MIDWFIDWLDGVLCRIGNISTMERTQFNVIGKMTPWKGDILFSKTDGEIFSKETCVCVCVGGGYVWTCTYMYWYIEY